MKKNIENIFIILILIFFCIEILTNSENTIESVIKAIEIWKNNIFPSLFPFFIISELLIHYGFVELINELCKNIMYKLFKINGYASFVFIMSLISGFPSSAKYTKELYLNQKLNENEATKLLTFTHFSNPLFILGTISILFLKNKEIGLLILLCHYLPNIIIGIIFRNYYPSNINMKKTSIKQAIFKVQKKRIENSIPFGKVISIAINNTIQTLLLILGTITIFLLITNVIDNKININEYYQAILNGIIEMTQGLNYISLLDIPLKIKSVLTVMILSFGGLSVHIQIFSILSETKIKYLPFLAARLLHTSISGILLYLTFDIFINVL